VSHLFPRTPCRGGRQGRRRRPGPLPEGQRADRDAANAGLNIPAYNGGLFAPDPALDSLQVPDEVCAHFKDLGDYDYRPACEVADADESTEVRSVIDVDILGHIFEQSITDLERLRLSLETNGRASVAASPNFSEIPIGHGSRGRSPSQGDSAGRRPKQEGAVYTPAFISRYLVQQALALPPRIVGSLISRIQALR
jgi:hypothetical protein